MEKFNDKQMEHLKKFFSFHEDNHFFILVFKTNEHNSILIWLDKNKEDSFLDQLYDKLQEFENDLDSEELNITYEKHLNKLNKIYEELENLNG